MNIKKTFSLFLLFSLFFTLCCSAEREHNLIRRIGEHTINMASSGALTGVLTCAALTTTTTPCCIIYSVGAGACGTACITTTAFTYQLCREYREHQHLNANHHHAVEPIRYNLPQVQQVMGIAPQAIQPRLQ